MTRSINSLAVWLAPDQVALIAEACDRAGVRISAAGSSVPGASAAVARDLGTEHASDLRVVLRTTDADAVLLCDPGDFGGRPDDRGDLAAAIDAGRALLTLCPLAGSLREWRELRGASASVSLAGPDLTLAGLTADARESFGRCDAASLVVLGPSAALPLGGRLVSGLAMLDELFGEPEAIEAQLAGTTADTLCRVAGRVTAHLRYPAGSSATLLASDGVASEHTGLTLTGEGGVLHARDGGLAWAGPDGTQVEWVAPGRSAPDAAQVLAERLKRAWMVSPATAERSERTLAASDAVLLAARTGEPVSLETVRDMAHRV